MRAITNAAPRMYVQRMGAREWGPMAWRAWVSVGLIQYCGEHGTYAWTQKGAERKARRLLRHYERSRPHPAIEIDKGD